MELHDRSITASTILVGYEDVTVLSGKKFRIENQGQPDVLDVTVPIGKTWKIQVGITIIET